MKSILVALIGLVALAAADDSQAIRDLCRFRVGNFPHPNPDLCYQYVQCQFFNGVVRECEEIDEIFAENEGCVLGDRTTCERFIPAPTVPTFPTDPTPPIDGVCNGIPLGFLPNPSDCTAFILCIFELPEFLSCPSQTPIYDRTRESCVPGDPTTCEIFGNNTPPPPTVTPPTQPPPTVTVPTITFPTITFPTTTSSVVSTTTSGPTASPPPRDACRGNNFRFFPDQNSCYRYYFCVFGTPIPGKCDSNRIFYKRIQGCVKGDQQTCVRNRFFDIDIVTNRPIF